MTRHAGTDREERGQSCRRAVGAESGWIPGCQQALLCALLKCAPSEGSMACSRIRCACVLVMCGQRAGLHTHEHVHGGRAIKAGDMLTAKRAQDRANHASEPA